MADTDSGAGGRLGRSDAGIAGGARLDVIETTRARGRTGWGKLRDFVLVALALIAGTAAIGAYATYRIWEVGRRDERRPADAIVVLGAAQYNGKPSPVLAARIDHAIDLYKDGLAPYFVVTGGKLPGDRVTEAASERDYAVRRGVPASAILMEDTGRTTLESMENVRALFQRHGLHSALFVSDRTHMLRVLKMASDQGIQAYGSPTSTSPADATLPLRVDATAHELGGLALYFFVEQPASRPPATVPPSVSARGTPAAAARSRIVAGAAHAAVLGREEDTSRDGARKVFLRRLSEAPEADASGVAGHD